MILIRRPFSHQLHGLPNKKQCTSHHHHCHSHASPNVILFRHSSSDMDKAKSLEIAKSQGKEAKYTSSASSVVYHHQGRNMQLAETNEHLFLSLDLPGVKKQDLQVQALNDRLRIEAKRGSNSLTPSSTLSREFVVDALTTDLANLKADLTDGVLTIELPKKEYPEPADIAINSTEYPPEDRSDKNLELNLDLPGVKASDITAEFNGKVITVQAKRTRGRITVSSINREIPVDSERFVTSNLQAYLADGVLTITAPQRTAPAATKVSVSTNSPHLPSSTTAPESEDKEEEEEKNIEQKETTDSGSVDKSKDATDEEQPSDETGKIPEEDVVVETVEEKEDDKEWQHVRE